MSDTGEDVPAGGLYLAQVGDRELGSYYTPRDLVAFTLEQSLDLLIDERLEGLQTVEEQEEALLALRCIDPACGSGAFLVSVIDRIAVRLAEVRLDGSQPNEHQLSLARRDVLQHCIYGVDVDRFAVELCKVALWIHCAVSDLPLTFLDHRIQHGNSLIGWPLRDIPTDIPLDAYQTKGKTKGDEETKAICQSARDQNKRALEGQGDLFSSGVARPDVRLDYPPLWEEEERTPADVDKKLATYRDYLESLPYRLWQAAADLWVSSFFWTADFGDQPPISTDYWHARSVAEGYRDGTISDADAIKHLESSRVRAASRIAEELSVFHWAIRFPEIAERGGFDLVTGNPPWEVVKLQEQEWFATRDPAIASVPSAVRRGLIAALDTQNPELAAAWRLASSATARQAEFMRYSGRYVRSGNEPNTYLLFTESNASNTFEGGRAGFLVKTSLGTDKGGQATFQPLALSGRIHGFFDIVNGGRGFEVIFDGIAQVERFAVLSIGPTRVAGQLAVSMMNFSVDEARQRDPYVLSSDDLKVLNPVTRSLPSFRSHSAWEIGIRLQRAHPTLDFDNPTAAELESGARSPAENPWGIRYATLFHSSGDQSWFLRREDLEDQGWQLDRTMIFRHSGRVALPLYEGQLMNRYDHRAKTYAGYPIEKKYSRKPGIPPTSTESKMDVNFEAEPRYWVLEEEFSRRRSSALADKSMIALRNVGGVTTNRRTLVAALLPARPATHGLPLLGCGELTFELLGRLNSVCADFLARGKLPGPNVAQAWFLSQLAVPLPTEDARIAANARRLSLTSTALAEEFGSKPHPWNPEERYELDVETDALVAHAYGVTAKEYEVMLDTFDVLARQEIKEHGRYRFKDDCLAAYRRVD